MQGSCLKVSHILLWFSSAEVADHGRENTNFVDKTVERDVPYANLNWNIIKVPNNLVKQRKILANV